MIEAQQKRVYALSMGRQHVTEGKPDDLIPVQIKMPVWMKKKALARAKDKGQDLSAYIKALIVADAGEKK